MLDVFRDRIKRAINKNQDISKIRSDEQKLQTIKKVIKKIKNDKKIMEQIEK